MAFQEFKSFGKRAKWHFGYCLGEGRSRASGKLPIIIIGARNFLLNTGIIASKHCNLLPSSRFHQHTYMHLHAYPWSNKSCTDSCAHIVLWLNPTKEPWIHIQLRAKQPNIYWEGRIALINTIAKDLTGTAQNDGQVPFKIGLGFTYLFQWPFRKSSSILLILVLSQLVMLVYV